MTTNFDELHAFQLAGSTASKRGWPWRPPYWIHARDGEWQVHAESECIIHIDADSGELIPELEQLDPLLALTHAKNMPWTEDCAGNRIFPCSFMPKDGRSVPVKASSGDRRPFT